MNKPKVNKTQKNQTSVTSYLQSLSLEDKRQAQTLKKIFVDTTGAKAKMWGESIIGFGEYHYKYESGREGDFLATGFSMRKSGPTIYIMPGYNDNSHLLKNLGPHKLGKSCLYIKSIADIDISILKQLIVAGLKDLRKQHPVKI